MFDHIIELIQGAIETVVTCIRYSYGTWIPSRIAELVEAEMDPRVFAKSAGLFVVGILASLVVAQFAGPTTLYMTGLNFSSVPNDVPTPELAYIWPTVFRLSCEFSTVGLIIGDLALRALNRKTAAPICYERSRCIFHVASTIITLRLLAFLVLLLVTGPLIIARHSETWINIYYYGISSLGLLVSTFPTWIAIKHYLLGTPEIHRPKRTDVVAVFIFGLTMVIATADILTAGKMAAREPSTAITVEACARRPFRIVGQNAELDLVVRKSDRYHGPLYLYAKNRRVAVTVSYDWAYEHKPNRVQAKSIGTLEHEGKPFPALLPIAEDAGTIVTLVIPLDDIEVMVSPAERPKDKKAPIRMFKTTVEDSARKLELTTGHYIVDIGLTIVDVHQRIWWRSYPVTIVSPDEAH
jgi:hypothetical protein